MINGIVSIVVCIAVVKTIAQFSIVMIVGPFLTNLNDRDSFSCTSLNLLFGIFWGRLSLCLGLFLGNLGFFLGILGSLQFKWNSTFLSILAFLGIHAFSGISFFVITLSLLGFWLLAVIMIGSIAWEIILFCSILKTITQLPIVKVIDILGIDLWLCLNILMMLFVVLLVMSLWFLLSLFRSHLLFFLDFKVFLDSKVMGIFEKLSFLSLVCLDSLCCFICCLELISCHFVKFDLFKFLEGIALNLWHCLIFINNSTFWKLVRAISVFNKASGLVDVTNSLLRGLCSSFLSISSLKLGLSLGLVECFSYFLSLNLVLNGINGWIGRKNFSLSDVIWLFLRGFLSRHDVLNLFIVISDLRNGSSFTSSWEIVGANEASVFLNFESWRFIAY